MPCGMESGDILLNLDWDPHYLRSIFDQDFYDMSSLWTSDYIIDKELVVSAKDEVYCPIVKDISIDDNVLVQAVSTRSNKI